MLESITPGWSGIADIGLPCFFSTDIRKYLTAFKKRDASGPDNGSAPPLSVVTADKANYWPVWCVTQLAVRPPL